jgi:D-lactate dehydrogenase
MAKIYFYDVTELDKKQLTGMMENSDHQWEFIEEKLSTENCKPDAEVISVFVSSSVTKDMIDAMPALKVIACRSTGFNNIDFTATTARDITVLNVPTYGESTVAEYTFTMLLALQRKLLPVVAAENAQFDQRELMGHDLDGKVFGCVGTGHIGQKAIKIANGFSMKVLAYDAFPKESLQQEHNFTYVSFDELLAQADIISLHIPYFPNNHHMFNAEAFAGMKQGAIFINTARGELVDSKALIDALEDKHLGGAAIDVIEGEALLNHHEETALLRSHILPESVLEHSLEISILKKMPNVIVSPHNAFNTEEAIGRINGTTVSNIMDFWYGNTPNRVNPSKKPTGKLLIARHAESEWNATGQWTGITDVHLSPKGFKDAAQLGLKLRTLDTPVDVAYCSQQIRTRETLEGMLNASQQFDVDIITDGAINERDYGEYTGKNKWQMKAILGEEAFNDLRRGWDVPVPGGETLKAVYERAVPFYKDTIVPLLLAGQNVLLVAHGNSIRALIKYIEDLTEEEIASTEMILGQLLIYEVNEQGQQIAKHIESINVSESAA